jgi:hypothetical protein
MRTATAPKMEVTTEVRGDMCTVYLNNDAAAEGTMVQRWAGCLEKPLL